MSFKVCVNAISSPGYNPPPHPFDTQQEEPQKRVHTHGPPPLFSDSLEKEIDLVREFSWIASTCMRFQRLRFELFEVRDPLHKDIGSKMLPTLLLLSGDGKL